MDPDMDHRRGEAVELPSKMLSESWLLMVSNVDIIILTTSELFPESNVTTQRRFAV